MHKVIKSTDSFGATTKTAVLVVVATAAVAALAGALASPSKVMADESAVKIFTIDVAYRNPYFQNNVRSVQEPTDFFPGDTFIQDGSIYPGYTIPDGATDFDPDTHPGVIGFYRARGTWTTDLAGYLLAVGKGKRAEREMAFATEIFAFQNDRSSILADGPLPNANFSANRVVLGGTQTYRDVIGEIHEANIGENKSKYCNLRVTFKIRKPIDDRWR